MAVTRQAHVGDNLRVIDGKGKGQEGECTWVGVTKFGNARVCVKTLTGLKVWAKPDEVTALNGDAVEFPNLQTPQPPRGGYARDQKGVTRAKVAVLETEVETLKKQVAELMALATAAKARRAQKAGS